MNRDPLLAPFVDALLERVIAIPPSTDVFAEGAVRGSLFDGAAGVALFLHEAARLRSAAVMDRADEWISVAERWARQATPADWELRTGRSDCGLLFGVGGIAYARVLISSSLGDSAGVARGVAMLASAEARVRDQPRFPTALYDGAAGLLCALRRIRALAGPGLSDDVSRIGNRLWPFLDEHLSQTAISDGGYLGMAHGIAGELWAAGTWLDESDALPSSVGARLGELLDLAEEDDAMILWPSIRGRPCGDDFSHTFCNGMTGHAYLWTMLAQRRVEGAERVAGLVANAMCALGPTTVPSLCCGLAGQAAVHLGLSFLAPSEAKHDRRAHARLRRAIPSWAGAFDAPEALMFWHGALGLATVAMRHEAGEPDVPCFELPPAPQR